MEKCPVCNKKLQKSNDSLYCCQNGIILLFCDAGFLVRTVSDAVYCDHYKRLYENNVQSMIDTQNYSFELVKAMCDSTNETSSISTFDCPNCHELNSIIKPESNKEYPITCESCKHEFIVHTGDLDKFGLEMWVSNNKEDPN